MLIMCERRLLPYNSSLIALTQLSPKPLSDDANSQMD